MAALQHHHLMYRRPYLAMLNFCNISMFQAMLLLTLLVGTISISMATYSFEQGTCFASVACFGKQSSQNGG